MDLYTVTAGGLGDIFFNYLNPGYATGYIQHIRKHHPVARIRVMVFSPNPQAADLYAPLDVELVWRRSTDRWEDHVAKLAGDSAYLTSAVTPEWEWERPGFFLEKDERERAAGITDAPYACVHPFAGTPDRRWEGHVDTELLIERLRDKGYRVVILGGGHGEMYRSAHDVVNLVNRASARLQAHLAVHSSVYYGSQSCYCVPAVMCGVPTTIVTNPSFRKDYRADGLGVFKHLHQSAQIFYFNQLNDLYTSI